MGLVELPVLAGEKHDCGPPIFGPVMLHQAIYQWVRLADVRHRKIVPVLLPKQDVNAGAFRLRALPDHRKTALRANDGLADPIRLLNDPDSFWQALGKVHPDYESVS